MHFDLMISGIALAWLALGLYVATLANRQRKLSQEIARLKDSVEQR